MSKKNFSLKSYNKIMENKENLTKEQKKRVKKSKLMQYFLNQEQLPKKADKSIIFYWLKKQQIVCKREIKYIIRGSSKKQRMYFVNRIKHMCTNYEELLSKLCVKPYFIETYFKVNIIIYNKIKQVYPELIKDCDRCLNRLSHRKETGQIRWR